MQNHDIKKEKSIKNKMMVSETIKQSRGCMRNTILAAYCQHAASAYRTLLGNVLERCLTEPLLKVRNLPSYGVATLTAQEKRVMIHLLCYVPEKRGAVMEIIEEPSVAAEVGIQLRTDGRRVNKAYLAPSGEKIPFTLKNGYVSMVLPKLTGCKILVAEYE